MTPGDRLLHDIVAGHRPSRDEARRLLDVESQALLSSAADLAAAGHGRVVTYSRKVFIPLTRLCRDVCSYCTFAAVPRKLARPYMTRDEVLAIANAGVATGCREALFTLGDRPEARYSIARRALAERGHARTLDLLGEMAAAVVEGTGLLPHLNPGLMAEADFRRLRPAAVSMGLMLESSASRLCERGGPHFGSPDKRPDRRLAAIDAAGRAGVPLTTGILIGIGETRAERLESLLAIRDLHDRHGHVQDLIVQNFRAKADTRMADAPDASLDEQLWTNAVARLLFGAEMSIQAPPNLRPDDLLALLGSGINDWGGVSPVTPDHVNPESPWPQLPMLEAATAATGRVLVERLAITPRYARHAADWVDAALLPRVLRQVDGHGLVRQEDWHAGLGQPVPVTTRRWTARTVTGALPSRAVREALGSIARGETPEVDDVAALFAAHGADLVAVLGAADRLCRDVVGGAVGYVVNRNINYTNVCTHRCGFCAFSKGRSAASLRGPGYRLSIDEIAHRAVEAVVRGATEVCLQGGIHPAFTGETYLEIVTAIRRAAPSLHVHAFSPLEVTHGARSLGLPLADYLRRLKDAGLGSLPGTAAEILVDDVRAVLCPDKLTTDEWFAAIDAAHRVGLPTTATIMFGHVDSYANWATHLLRLRVQQSATGGFTEFVPLPFVHLEAPLWRQGRARSGPSFREAMLMHAVARLVLHPWIRNVQASWAKLGLDGLAFALTAGANDMGGTLMDESITRAAGGAHGQNVDPAEFERLAASIGRPAWQRTTLYRPARRSVAASAVDASQGACSA